MNIGKNSGMLVVLVVFGILFSTGVFSAEGQLFSSQTFVLGNSLTIDLKDKVDSIDIGVDDKRYSFIGILNDSVKFTPQMVGNHSVEIKSDNVTFKSWFLVIPNISEKDPLFTISNHNVSIFEKVVISLRSNITRIEIVVGDQHYQYFGPYDGNVSFLPDQIGVYHIYAYTESDFQELNFSVHLPVLRLFDAQNDIYFEKEITEPLLDVDNFFVNEIRLNTDQRGFNYGIDIFNSDVAGFDLVRGYAIEGNSDSAELVITAEGTRLYSCRSWDFYKRTCYSEWEQVVDLIPGENYSISMSRDSIAYAEVMSDIVIDDLLSSQDGVINDNATPSEVMVEFFRNLTPVIVREQASGIGLGRNVTITYFLFNNYTVPVSGILQEIVPNSWDVLSVPEETNQNGSILSLVVNLSPSEVKLVEFDYKSPGIAEVSIFKSEFIHDLGKYNISNHAVECNHSKAFFDTTVIVDRTLIYDGELEFSIANFGNKSVVDFETFFTWNYNASLIKVKKTEKNCKDYKDHVVCSWQPFNEGEIENVSIEIELLGSGMDIGLVNVTYDPPIKKNFIGKITDSTIDFWSSFADFFRLLFLGNSITGRAVQDTVTEGSVEEAKKIVDRQKEVELDVVIDGVFDADAQESQEPILSAKVLKELGKNIWRYIGPAHEPAKEKPKKDGSLKEWITTFKTLVFRIDSGIIVNTSIKDHLGHDIQHNHSFRKNKNGNYDLEVNLKKKRVKKITFQDVRIKKSQISFNYADVSPLRDAPYGLSWDNVYAIDASAMNFSNATVEVNARGRALYKCALWNFSEQGCYGNWEKVMDLVPGKAYNITLYPGDPGYAEVGLIAINTHKSIYLPNETAFIGIGVLDGDGFVVCNATVNLTITDPSGANTTLSTVDGTVVVSDECPIYNVTDLPDYYANYTVGSNGTYLMSLVAWTYNGTPVRESSFIVQDAVAFDVARDGPTRVYPPVPYTMNFSIKANTNYSGSIYEIVPNDFTISTQSGLSVADNGSHRILDWNQIFIGGYSYELGYEFYAPDISPYFYTFGPLTIGNWSEVREWQIANDATSITDTGISANPNPVTEGNTIDITGNIYGSGGGGKTFYVWVEDDGVQIDTTSSGRDFYCTGSSQVSIDLCEADSCVVQADCSVYVTNLNNKDDVDITWTFVANQASTSTLQMDADIPDSFNNNVVVTINAAADPYPQVNPEEPAANYVNDTNLPPIGLYFNCSATDTSSVENISLFITNTLNSSFSEAGTCSVGSSSGSCRRLLNLSNGVYTWGCRAIDDGDQINFSVNRTVRINFSDLGPATTLLNPAPNYNDATQDPTNVVFNCSAIDGVEVANISLYLTNAVNQSFSWNDSCVVGSDSGFCNWTVELGNGNYTWNCLSYDNISQADWGNSNRTLVINYTAGVDLSPTVSLISPPNGTSQKTGNVSVNCTATDDNDITNISLYTNTTGSWGEYDAVSFDGIGDTSVAAAFNITNIVNNTYFIWNCFAYDNASKLGYQLTNNSYKILHLPAPSATLLTPANNSLYNVSSVTVTCNAMDDDDIANVNLFTNRSGNFAFEQTSPYPGPSNTNVNASFDITGIIEDVYFYWTCFAIDNASNEVLASQNYTLSIDIKKPNITQISPDNEGYDVDGTFSITCQGEDESDIVNISLYTNLSGSWALNSTVGFTGGSDTNVSAIFNISGLSNGVRFFWNCFGYDDDGNSDWGNSNRTFTITSLGIDFYSQPNAYDASWANSPGFATSAPNEVDSFDDIDSNHNLRVFNFENLPTTGTLLQTFFSIRFWASSLPTDDEFNMQYSDDNGSTYYDLDGTAYNGDTGITSFPLERQNQTHEITGSLTLSDLQNLRLGVVTVKHSPGDKVVLYIDSIWVRIVYSPPPTPSQQIKNDSQIFQNDSVQFNITWTDDIGLGCSIFSINQTGVWENFSCIDLDWVSDIASHTLKINASAGTVVGWKFYANDSFGEWNLSPILTFAVSDAADNTPPLVGDPVVSPQSAESLSIFNITATITDNVDVSEAYAELLTPDGTKINYSMIEIGSDVWQYLHNATLGGNYSVYVYGLDGNDNSNVSSTNAVFNVTSELYILNDFYHRGERMGIVGYGFSSSAPVTIDIKDESGTSVGGFPENVTSTIDGNISTYWDIPAVYTYQLQNFTIYANDTTDASLSDDHFIMLVVRPSTSVKYDDVTPGGGDVLGKVNNSDLLNATLVASGSEIYLQSKFTENIAEGYSLDQAILYVKHLDLDGSSNTLDVYYYDGSDYQPATCGSITFRPTMVFDVCNLTPDLGSIPNKNDIRIRISDGNDGTDGEDFSIIDFVFLDIDFSIGNVMSITIEEPEAAGSVYDFTDTVNNDAYDGQINSEPPGTQQGGSEASSLEYGYMDTLDSSRWNSYTQSSGYNVYQSFYFTVSETEADIIKLTLKHVGYATQLAAGNADGFRIWMWNYSGTGYVRISGDPIAGAQEDLTTEIEMTSGISDFIDTDGRVNVFIEGDYTLTGCGQPSNCRADLFTNYISLTATTITTISGTQPINVTAIDGDGVDSCTYYYSNSTVLPLYGLENLSSIMFYNTSNTLDYANGIYNITANCTDAGGEHNSTYITVRVDNNAPTVILNYPANNSNYTATNDLSFTWNVSYSGGNPYCNLSIDNIVNVSNILVLSGQNKTVNVSGFSDGRHNWSVSCWGATGIVGTSERWYFDVDLAAPTVTLNSPAPGAWKNESTVIFYYTPNDVHDVDNCSIYIDGVFNKSNSTITRGVQNNFNVSGYGSGSHNWTVRCYDEFGWLGNSTARSFKVDLMNPWIDLQSPNPGETILGGFTQFNYTAYDDQSTTLICDIIVDGVVIDDDYSTSNGSLVVRNKAIGDGFKLWNVSCRDQSGRVNVSETRNFTVSGDPTVVLEKPNNMSYQYSYDVVFNYTAEDNDGLANCSLYINEVWNQVNSTSLLNGETNQFNVTLASEGTYNWTVQCFDTTGRNKKPNNRLFIIDRSKPQINIQAPTNKSNYTQGNVQFNFTVIDVLDPTLLCNLTIDGTASNFTNIVAANNSLNIWNETGLADGSHWWNVTCADSAGNINTSETRQFTVAGAPLPELYSPGDGDYNIENVSFMYYLTAANDLVNCSLYINGQWNMTNSSPEKDAYNTFNVYGMTEQTLTWNVSCFDDVDKEGWSETWTLYIDNTGPNITLNYPDGDTISSSTINFNFTTTDNNDSVLDCDLYIDAVWNDSLTANSDEQTVDSVVGLAVGSHNWSVSCADDAGIVSYSQTNSFLIFFGPSVSLNQPEDEDVISSTDVYFNYTVNSDYILINCSLIINGTFNASNSSAVLTGGTINNFYVTGLNYGIYNWTVNCIDNNSVSGNDTEQIVHIDGDYPEINLSYPANSQELSRRNITFNFTVTDDVDNMLVCNISFNDSSFNVYNITAYPGMATSQLVTGFTGGAYSWNVSCSDGLFINTSENWNFTVNPIPSVLLSYPPNTISLSNNSINFTFSASTIADGGFLYCQLVIDGELSNFDTAIANGELNGIVNDSLSEGEHNWSVYCIDKDSYNTTTDAWVFTIDLTNPWVDLHGPDDGSIINLSTVVFNFTANDNLDTSLVCNITLDGVNVSPQNIAATNASPTNITVNDINDSIHWWNVSCVDDSGRGNISVTYNFTVQEPPTISLGNPSNNQRSTATSQTMFVTATDNSGILSNCTLIFDGLQNQSNITALVSGTESNFSVSGLSDGKYNWTVNCTDYYGNEGTNETPKYFIVDLTAPEIVLHHPSEGDQFNYDDIEFNWTPTDAWGEDITCNFSLDGAVNVSGITTYSGNVTNLTKYNLSFGPHNYSVRCWDDLNNSAVSDFVNFTINSPDVTINATEIYFNNTNPDPNEPLNITATIWNNGGVDAEDTIIQFWDNGVQINGNITATIGAGNLTNVSVAWTITAGLHTITVILNPDGAADLIELNYSNNNASINISTLTSTVNVPDNGSWIKSGGFDLNFTVRDYFDGSLNYTVYVNGTVNATGQTTDGTQTVESLVLGNGLFLVVVEADDLDGRLKNSTILYVYLDNSTPVITFVTSNLTWFSTADVDIVFNITDNLDSVINFTLFLNGAYKGIGSVDNGGENTTTLLNLLNGTYVYTVQAVDETNNTLNASIVFYVDTAPPEPFIETDNLTWFSSSTPNISFIVNDSMDSLINYTIYVNDSINVWGITANATVNWTILSSLSDGMYLLILEAEDNAGNKKNSSMKIIYIDSTEPQITIQNPSTNEVLGWVIDLLSEVTDGGGIGINYSRYEITNSSGHVVSFGNLNSTFNWDASWNSSEVVDNSSDEVYFNFTVFANDSLGNTANLSVQFVVDNRKPSINMQYPTGQYISSSFNLDIRAQNTHLNRSWYNITNSSGYEMQNNSNLSINQATHNWTDLVNIVAWAEGVYNISIYAEDVVGNNRTSYTYFIVDRTDPVVVLISPVDYYNSSIENISFRFNVTDNFDSNLTCNLSIDGGVNQSMFGAVSAEITIRNVTEFSEGWHYWSVTCWDDANNTNITEEWNFSIDSRAPSISLLSPANNSWNAQSVVSFSYNVTDFSEIQNCSLIINGTVNQYNQSPVTKGSSNSFSAAFADGYYNWTVNCTDERDHAGTNASLYVFYVDTIDPEPVIETANESWFNTASPSIDFHIDDNLAPAISYQFFVNDSTNTGGSVTNGISDSATITGLNNGTYLIIVQGTDIAGNAKNSSMIVVYIDTVKPTIVLTAPENDSNHSTQSIQFNFTVFDNMDTSLVCNLTTDGVVNVSGISAVHGTLMNITVDGFNLGLHNWTVICWDSAGNVNNSELWYFRINPPDMMVNETSISFNVTSSFEFEPVLVSGIVWNIGGADAENLMISFYDGYPGAGGIQIEDNITANISQGESIIANVTWIASTGDHIIYVIVDIDDDIEENDETNNEANKSINISLWHIIKGNNDGDLKLEDLENMSTFDWQVSNETGSNIFIGDSESAISWVSLLPLGRNSTLHSVVDDFIDLDDAMGTTNYSDSVNNTFSSNGVPKRLKTFYLFRNITNNVPIDNSSNVSTFVTGIVWDLSDGGPEFNGSQDVLFVSEMNSSAQGGYGVYDFEIKIPSLLRLYKKTEQTKVVFYTELK